MLGILALVTFFCDNADVADPLAEDGTTIKFGSTKSHFIWDHGRHERHFMHGSSQITELYLYVSHGYFTAFCTRVNKFLFEKAYSIDPHTSDATHPDGPYAIPYGEGDLDGEEPHHQWYRPEIANTTDQYIDSNPKPKTQVTWSDYNKPPASSGSTTPLKSRYFQIGMDLTYFDRMGKSLAVVY